MGLIATLLSFTRVEKLGVKKSVVKAQIEGGNIRTFDHVSPAGDDAFPLKSDAVFAGRTQRTGEAAALGYIDTINIPKAQEGEKRIYSRNPADGQAIGEVWVKADGSVLLSSPSGSIELKADGSILLLNGAGSLQLKTSGAIAGVNGGGMFELESGGDFMANGAKITAAGDFLSAAGKSLDLHVHPINGGSSAPGPTGPPA